MLSIDFNPKELSEATSECCPMSSYCDFSAKSIVVEYSEGSSLLMHVSGEMLIGTPSSTSIDSSASSWKSSAHSDDSYGPADAMADLTKSTEKNCFREHYASSRRAPEHGDRFSIESACRNSSHPPLRPYQHDPTNTPAQQCSAYTTDTIDASARKRRRSAHDGPPTGLDSEDHREHGEDQARMESRLLPKDGERGDEDEGAALDGGGCILSCRVNTHGIPRSRLTRSPGPRPPPPPPTTITINPLTSPRPTPTSPMSTLSAPLPQKEREREGGRDGGEQV
jgi:hypothetical protein